MTLEHDVSICAGGEDQVGNVEALVLALRQRGVLVSYEEVEVRRDDTVVKRMQEALKISSFVVLVFTPVSSMRWRRAAVDAVLEAEAQARPDGKSAIIPVRFGMDHGELVRRYPRLAERPSMSWAGVRLIGLGIARLVRGAQRTHGGVAASEDQRRVIDAALEDLASRPGGLYVTGSELRFALHDLTPGQRDPVIRSCMPHLLERVNGPPEAYRLTLNGLLEASNPRAACALEVALELVAERYTLPGGRRQNGLLWSDIRKRGPLEPHDLDIVWQAITIGQVAAAGRPPVGASEDRTSPRYDYEFWLKHEDLELIYENHDLAAWAAVQRARTATPVPADTGRQTADVAATASATPAAGPIATMTGAPPPADADMKRVRVFVSYAHEDPAHDALVVHVVDTLRGHGIDARFDRHEPVPKQGWPRWIDEQVMAADHVLMVCTAEYRRRAEGRAGAVRGRGANYEGRIIDHAIYEAGGINEKFVPIVPDGLAADDVVPSFVRPYTAFTWPTQLEQLLRHLTSQPAHVPAPLGQVPVLPPVAPSPVRRTPPPKSATAAPNAHDLDLADQLRLRAYLGPDGNVAGPSGFEVGWKIVNEGGRPFDVSGVQLVLRTTRAFRLACEKAGLAPPGVLKICLRDSRPVDTGSLRPGESRRYVLGWTHTEARAAVSKMASMPTGWSAEWTLPRMSCVITGVDRKPREYALDHWIVDGPDVVIEPEAQDGPRELRLNVGVGDPGPDRRHLVLHHEAAPDPALHACVAAKQLGGPGPSERMILVAPEAGAPRISIQRRMLEDVAQQCRFDGGDRWSFPPMMPTSPGSRTDRSVAWADIEREAEFVLGTDGSFGLRIRIRADRKGQGYEVARGDVGLLTTLEQLLGALVFAQRLDAANPTEPPRRWGFSLGMDVANRHLMYDSPSTDPGDWQSKGYRGRIDLTGSFDTGWAAAELGTVLDEIAQEIAFFFAVDQRVAALRPGLHLVHELALP